MSAPGQTGALSWTEAGDTSARVLLLIHALGADRQMWEAQLPALAEIRRVVMVDLPGHGTSTSLPGPYTVRDLGEDVLDIATTAGADQFDLCGMSLGGLISLWMAAHAQDRVLSLVASNTAARIGSGEIWQARIDAVAEGGMAAVSEAALGRFFTPELASADPGTFERSARTLLATDPDAYMSCCAALRDADLRELVEAIHCPTLVIGGSHDISTPPEESVWLNDHIEGSKLVILEGAPHFSNLEQPETWTKAVAAFLTEQGAVTS
jgi:3-oxoadipate enol-lactonase